MGTNADNDRIGTAHAAILRDAMTPPPKTLPDNSVNGVPSNRRAHAGRDAALANGNDPLNPTKGRPAGV